MKILYRWFRGSLNAAKEQRFISIIIACLVKFRLLQCLDITISFYKENISKMLIFFLDADDSGNLMLMAALNGISNGFGWPCVVKITRAW